MGPVGNVNSRSSTLGRETLAGVMRPRGVARREQPYENTEKQPLIIRRNEYLYDLDVSAFKILAEHVTMIITDSSPHSNRLDGVFHGMPSEGKSIDN